MKKRIDIDIDDPASLPIYFWDEQGRHTPYSTEEVIANRLNGFQNWTCTAGRNSLFIHFDGWVHRGTCEVGGASGNIYEDFEFPNNDIVCPKTFCMCGGDIMVPKFKSPQNENIQFADRPASSRIRTPVAVTGSEVITPEHLGGARFLKRVVWSIGRRCNYSCSYCMPEVHSSKEALKSKDVLMTAARKLVDGFCKGHKTMFYIAGGEPTLYPGMVDVCRFLHENGHECVVISNGSSRKDLYRELVRYAHVCFSAHFEFLNEERTEKFVTNLRTMVEVLNSASFRGRPISHRVDVKLMTKPSEFDRSIDLAKRVLAIDGYRDHGAIRFNSMWHPDNVEKLLEYSKGEFDSFAELNNDRRQEEKFKPSIANRIQSRLRTNGTAGAAEELKSYLGYHARRAIGIVVVGSMKVLAPLGWKLFNIGSEIVGTVKKMGVAAYNTFWWNKPVRDGLTAIKVGFVRGSGYLKKQGTALWVGLAWARFWRRPYYFVVYAVSNPRKVVERIAIEVRNRVFYARIVRKPYHFIAYALTNPLSVLRRIGIEIRNFYLWRKPYFFVRHQYYKRVLGKAVPENPTDPS